MVGSVVEQPSCAHPHVQIPTRMWYGTRPQTRTFLFRSRLPAAVDRLPEVRQRPAPTLLRTRVCDSVRRTRMPSRRRDAGGGARRSQWWNYVICRMTPGLALREFERNWSVRVRLGVLREERDGAGSVPLIKFASSRVLLLVLSLVAHMPAFLFSWRSLASSCSHRGGFLHAWAGAGAGVPVSLSMEQVIRHQPRWRSVPPL